MPPSRLKDRAKQVLDDERDRPDEQFATEDGDVDAAIFGSYDKTPPPPRRASGITLADDGTPVIANVTITETGIPDIEKLSEKDWTTFGLYLRRVGKSYQWAVGDWLAYGQLRYGKSYEDAAAILGRSVKTLYNWAYACSNVEFSRRREKLTISHHSLVAPYAPSDQDQILQYALDNKLSVRGLQDYIDKSNSHNSPTLSANPLANRKNKRVFTRLYRSVSSGVGEIKREDIQFLKDWLAQVERILEDR